MKKFLYLFIKRIFDIIVSIFGCVLLLPITIIIKISYIFTKDYESIIFIQERIGKNGKIFKLYKYRTMYNNSEQMLHDLLKTNKKLGNEYKKYKKIKNDPRITKVGKIIRRFSIDEMPQFINVLKGEMTLIGNRPYLTKEKKDMKQYYHDIIKTKPGITGLWQTSGRNNLSFKKRLEIEKKYSNMCNLKLDLIIFFKTFKVLIFDKDI